MSATTGIHDGHATTHVGELIEVGEIDRSNYEATGTPPIAVLYENSEWMEELFDALDRRGLVYEPINLADGALLPDDPGDYALVINRVSPSAAIRGNGSAIAQTRRWLNTLERRGTRVINGADAFRVETSKVVQDKLIRGLGLTTPKTVVLRKQEAFDDLIEDFPFPAILKPDTGGSGAGVRFVGSLSHLDRLLDEEPDIFGPDEVMVLQEFITSADGSIMRTEFVGDELLFAMRVQPLNTFNLCPADGCIRAPADGEGEAGALFEYQEGIPAEMVEEARAILRAAGLDFGGVEYIEARDGRRYYYDINATSVYRSDIVAASGIDAMDRLVSFIEREAAQTYATRSGQSRAA